MSNTFQCSVITPQSVCLREQGTYASFQAFDGQKGVMPGASPFLTRLGAGIFTLTTASGSKTLLLDGGCAQMQGDELTLLADTALTLDAIDPKKSEEELQHANAKAISGGTSASARAASERAQQLAYAKVAAGRSRGSRN